jgi:hypothetical protein
MKCGQEQVQFYIKHLKYFYVGFTMKKVIIE